MRKIAVAAVGVFAACALHAPDAPVAPGAPFDFSRTMRVDYLHRGGPGGEALTLDRVSNDGAWPGSRTALIDDTGLGKYFFEVSDLSSNSVRYSRGFASIYGEWETTPEVRAVTRTFQESVRFPWPNEPMRLVIRKRDAENAFRDLWTLTVNPRSNTVSRHPPGRIGRVSTIFESGPSRSKIDVLLISDGYTAAQFGDFRRHAAKLLAALFGMEPFKTRRSAFNVRILEVPVRPLPVEFNIFGIERYALTYANRALRDLASTAPYDVIEILINQEKYGGGGIFNDQSTVAAANAAAEYVFVHELAHNLAGLADEYVGSVTYESDVSRGAEPWEPNITALHDPAMLKWRDLVEPGTPIPTPLSYAGRVGAFEGGGYEARGVFRPEVECLMGSRKLVPFCRVCQRAINRIIDLHTK